MGKWLEAFRTGGLSLMVEGPAARNKADQYQADNRRLREELTTATMELERLREERDEIKQKRKEELASQRVVIKRCLQAEARAETAEAERDTLREALRGIVERARPRPTLEETRAQLSLIGTAARNALASTSDTEDE